MKKKIAVLGGGISGVVAARELSKKPDFEVDLFEKNFFLGGLHRSVRKKSRVFDIGPFIFWDPFELFEVFPLAKNYFFPVDLKAYSITPQGKYDQYPMSLKGYLKNNGPLVFLLSAFDLLFSKLKYKKRDNVRSYAKYHTGSLIYEKSGLRYYIERFYGLKDDEISLQFAEKRLNMINEFSPFKYFLKHVQKRFFAQSLKNERIPIVHSQDGFQSLYEHIKEQLELSGTTVTVGADLKQIRRHGEKFMLYVNGQKKDYHKIISTIPIPAVLKLIGDDTQPGIKCIHLLSLFYIGIVKKRASIIFNHTARGKWKKITVFSD
ncbi:MAG: FAD-dependent oxidoreductase, partial [Candidatus Aureabacteria bacterium]|nr:FAD-dependent oxidoreductase [Candidatus Auribacterota bacterium]